MKQSAAKTLGVAALGAAFAAAGAGAAHATPALPAVPVGPALGAVSQLPTENLSQPVQGADRALAKGEGAVTTGLNAAEPAAERLLAGRAAGAPGGLLGGLPTNGLPVQGLPTQGLPVNGMTL
jgi:hypothetical protein